jgi:hypothetical protein
MTDGRRTVFEVVQRMQTEAKPNALDMGTFYTPGPKGYTDYPTLQSWAGCGCLAGTSRPAGCADGHHTVAFGQSQLIDVENLVGRTANCRGAWRELRLGRHCHVKAGVGHLPSLVTGSFRSFTRLGPRRLLDHLEERALVGHHRAGTTLGDGAVLRVPRPLTPTLSS